MLHNIPDWHTLCNDTIKNRIKESKNFSEKKDLNEEIEEDMDEYLRKKIKKEVQDEKWPCLFCDKVNISLKIKYRKFLDVSRGTICF